MCIIDAGEATERGGGHEAGGGLLEILRSRTGTNRQGELGRLGLLNLPVWAFSREPYLTAAMRHPSKASFLTMTGDLRPPSSPVLQPRGAAEALL